MNKTVQGDLTHFVKQLVLALQPMAKKEEIALTFASAQPAIQADFQPPVLGADILSILCRLIEFTPSNEKIIVSVEVIDARECKIKIKNTGINLRVNYTITSECKLPIAIISAEEKSTSYEMTLELVQEKQPLNEEVQPKHSDRLDYRYYDEIRKRLRSHFSKTENLVAVLNQYNPREAAFLARVNALIISNIENTQFDANHLSDAMNMSRTQLFRRLKPIINQSAGSYVRMVKLQKAKELLETTDMRISEVAYKTGFETASNFTKVFTKQYGMNPSLLFPKKKDVTNE